MPHLRPPPKSVDRKLEELEELITAETERPTAKEALHRDITILNFRIDQMVMEWQLTSLRAKTSFPGLLGQTA